MPHAFLDLGRLRYADGGDKQNAVNLGQESDYIVASHDRWQIEENNLEFLP